MHQELNSEGTVTLDDIMEMSEEELNELIEEMTPNPPTLDDIIKQRDYVAQQNNHDESMVASVLSIGIGSWSVFLVLSIYMARENNWSLAISTWYLIGALLMLLIFGTIIVFISNFVARMLRSFFKRLRSWIPWIKN